MFIYHNLARSKGDREGIINFQASTSALLPNLPRTALTFLFNKFKNIFWHDRKAQCFLCNFRRRILWDLIQMFMMLFRVHQKCPMQQNLLPHLIIFEYTSQNGPRETADERKISSYFSLIRTWWKGRKKIIFHNT